MLCSLIGANEVSGVKFHIEIIISVIIFGRKTIEIAFPFRCLEAISPMFVNAWK